MTAEQLLKTTPIFSRLNAADRAAVAAVAAVRHYPKGEAIFEQESPSDALYAIISGRVKIRDQEVLAPDPC
ncbi:MAG TPA: cyclic nucleotide-binding domain-containing protein [Vicinamibacterales bacterium]|nr:cyclic nucleotide-binding domain-containing protein [Vicinamibacterales bacterium]